MNFKIPLKTFKINFQNSNIYELIGKIKLIKEIISNLSDEEIQANKNEFIIYSESLDNLLYFLYFLPKLLISDSPKKIIFFYSFSNIILSFS